MSERTEKIREMASLISLSAQKRLLRKAVLSRPTGADIKRIVITPRLISGVLCLQAESFCADNKARHENIALDGSEADRLCELGGGFMQIDLITELGECEYKESRSGKCVLLGTQRLGRAILEAESGNTNLLGNDKVKNYLIPPDAEFLKYLGVSDKSGRVHDKRQSKFRQINKFVENVRDIYPELPQDGTLTVYDLCCGKSYLSFAVYYYLTCVLGRSVEMYGVDLKSDVIEYCNSVSSALGFSGLRFFCGDIAEYKCESTPDLVISLHACDIATDIVIDNAIAEGARVILSTPCCHHELNHRINCKALSFVTEYSMLRQKLCDAATDALRLKRLEANNYACVAVELIDPEETPKNILLRAIKRPATPANLKRSAAAAREYEAARAFLLGTENGLQEF